MGDLCEGMSSNQDQPKIPSVLDFCSRIAERGELVVTRYWLWAQPDCRLYQAKLADDRRIGGTTGVEIVGAGHRLRTMFCPIHVRRLLMLAVMGTKYLLFQFSLETPAETHGNFVFDRGESVPLEQSSRPSTLGVFGTDSMPYPTHTEIDYYASKGLDVIRLPFLWERLQRTSVHLTWRLRPMDDIMNYASGGKDSQDRNRATHDSYG